MQTSSDKCVRPSEGYVLSEKVVAVHNTRHDAWVVWDDSVYDVTMFIDSHPGGSAILLPHLGTDVTNIMNNDVPHLHSDYAYKLLSKYRVGTLRKAASSKPKTSEGAISPDKLDNLIDWTKPLLPQIGNMGPLYDEWVHSFPTTDHTVKMFQSDTLEFLTKCPWYVPLVFWIPIILVIVSYYFATLVPAGQFSAPRFSALALSGFVAWLLFEYVLHRYLFHLKTSTYWMNIFHFLIHGHHHITPMDNNRVVFPPVPALLIGGPVWIAVVWLAGFELGYAFLLGFAVGYLHYDMTHFFIHQTAPKSPMLQWHKRRHIQHHYHNPNSNFGISNPLFDVVFGTLVDNK